MSEPHPQSSWQPVSAEEFLEWFDSDGRLVKEVTMRQRVFLEWFDSDGRLVKEVTMRQRVFEGKHCVSCSVNISRLCDVGATPPVVMATSECGGVFGVV